MTADDPQHYTEANLSPVRCRGCRVLIPTALANAGIYLHPTCEAPS